MWRCPHYVTGVLLTLCLAAASVAGPPRLIADIPLPFTSSAAPAVGDLNGDGQLDVVVTSDHIGDVTRERADPRNVNGLCAFTWRDGRLRPLPGWPRKTRDAAMGIALADLNGDGRDDVIASCSQDFADPLLEAAGYWLVSRLYVFRGDGSPLPGWFPAEQRRPVGQIAGHAYAAPVVVGTGGVWRIVQSSQGAWDSGAFRRGGMRLWAPDGRLAAFTGMAVTFGVGEGFSLDAPPLLAELTGAPPLEMVAASNDGRLYAWTLAGVALPGWFPAPGARTTAGAALRAPASAVDLDGDGRDEVLSGSYDGYLRCWNSDGALRWKTAPPGKESPLSSGVAAGRLRNGKAFVAQGALDGRVTAWDSLGRVLWSAVTTPKAPVMAEPAVGDVDGDGDQDVVCGGTDGFVYAWDAATGKRLWSVPTVYAPSPEGQRLQGVFGAPALADLRGDGSLCLVVATGGRYVVDVTSRRWQGFGRLLVYDVGKGKRAPSAWPQYRGSKERAGRLVPSREKR